jgi:hypothetical protein
MMHREIYRDSTSRVVIDVAIGVLVGLRHCSEREAFNEIVSAVRETGIGVGTVSRALVGLASGQSVEPNVRLEPALRRWRPLIGVPEPIPG